MALKELYCNACTNFILNIVFSLFERATSHSADTIINELTLRSADNSNADSKSIHFHLSNHFIGVDNIATDDFDVGGWW